MLDVDHGAGTDDDSLEEPGQTETHEDVEDVAADGVTHGHVTVALLDDTDATESVRNAHTGRDEGEAHDGVGDPECEPDDGDHPDHHVATTSL